MNKRIELLLTQNLQFFTQLIREIDKNGGDRVKYLIAVCMIAIRENRKLLEQVQQIEIIPADEEAEEYVTQLHLSDQPEKEPELTEDEKRDILELEKIYNVPDPEPENWFKRLIKGKQ